MSADDHVVAHISIIYPFRRDVKMCASLPFSLTGVVKQTERFAQFNGWTTCDQIATNDANEGHNERPCSACMWTSPDNSDASAQSSPSSLQLLLVQNRLPSLCGFSTWVNLWHERLCARAYASPSSISGQSALKECDNDWFTPCTINVICHFSQNWVSLSTNSRIHAWRWTNNYGVARVIERRRLCQTLVAQHVHTIHTTVCICLLRPSSS